MVYNSSGTYAYQRPVYVGAVLDADSEADRFTAMKELLDYAKTTLAGGTPSAVSKAGKAAVALLPVHEPAMFEAYSIPWIYTKSGDTRSVPASTTKVMSLVTGLPYITNIMDKITLVADDIQSGSGNYFSAGDVLTFNDLVYGMMLPSSNTCARAFAHHVGALILGNSSATVDNCVTAFVSEMNKKAALLGCTNSTFTTPSGLSTTNYSTVKDMVRFTIEACSFPEILRVWGKKTYTIDIGGTNPRSQIITTTVQDATLEASYTILGGKTGHVLPSYEALVMVATDI